MLRNSKQPHYRATVNDVFGHALSRGVIHMLVIVPLPLELKHPSGAIDEPVVKRLEDAIVWKESTTLPPLEFSNKTMYLSSAFLHGSIEMGSVARGWF